MSLLQEPFVVRFRWPAVRGIPPSGELSTGLHRLGRVESIELEATDGNGSPTFEGKVLVTEPRLSLWLEEASRARGLFIDPDLLFEMARPDVERNEGLSVARRRLEHYLAAAPLVFQDESQASARAELALRPATAGMTYWDSEPWKYRAGPIPRRCNPRPLPLHAPEFDLEWSDEYRMALLAAPPARPFNTIPLLGTFVRPWNYDYAVFWDWQIVEILLSSPGRPPRDALDLNAWYPAHPQRPPPLEDLTDWTSRRLLDGFSGLPLQAETHRGETRYLMEMDWSDLPASGGYELPNVTVFWERSGRRYALTRIEILRRKLRWSLWPLPDGWRAHPGKYFDICSVTPSKGDRLWQHALFVARSAALLAGEVDVHLARAHLLVEGFAVMLETDGTAPELLAVRRLLAPFLRDVSGINRLGDALIMGRQGVLVAASGLTAESLDRRLASRHAATDWKGFVPRDAHPILADAHYPRAAQAFWSGIGALVEERLDRVPSGEQAGLVEKLAECVGKFNRLFGGGQVLAPRPGARFVWPAEWERQLDPGNPRMSVPASFKDVKRLCRYVIFHAVFVHGWVNDEAWIDGGSLEHAVFGLRHLDPPAKGQAWREWWLQAGPTLPHAAMQLAIGWTLDQVSWGKMGDPGDRTKRETVDKYLHEELDVFVAFHDAMREGTPSPEAELCQIGRPLPGWRIRINS